MKGPTLEHKKQKRLAEWKSWIEMFMNQKNEPIANQKLQIKQIEFAAELLNDFYWRLYKSSLKGQLRVSNNNDKEPNLHYYKIISASEITVMTVLPFELVNENDQTSENNFKINAEFALFVALSLLTNWELTKPIINLEAIRSVSSHKELIDIQGGNEVNYPLTFVEEHIQWLMQLNVAAGPLPVLLNSQLWRLFFLAVKYKAETLQ